MGEIYSFPLGPHEYYVDMTEGDVWRSGVHGAGRRRRVNDDEVRAFVRALAESEFRCNEYHETTERQAKRITELEGAVVEAVRQIKNVTEDCYKPGVLHCAACARSLNTAREILASACSREAVPAAPTTGLRTAQRGCREPLP